MLVLWIEKVIILGFAHAVFDCALQTEWMGKNKSIRMNDTHINHRWVLLAHAMTNGAGVWLVTQNVWLGVAETVWHYITDGLSTDEAISFREDQLSHGLSKCLWALLW